MLVSLNRFFDFLGWQECKVKPLRIQRRLFREESKELTREEYQRLLAAARALGRERLELLMETICATGIRVSEVKYITVEAAQAGRAEISLKGKLRTILLPGKLCRTPDGITVCTGGGQGMKTMIAVGSPNCPSLAALTSLITSL